MLVVFHNMLMTAKVFSGEFMKQLLGDFFETQAWVDPDMQLTRLRSPVE